MFTRSLPLDLDLNKRRVLGTTRRFRSQRDLSKGRVLGTTPRFRSKRDLSKDVESRKQRDLNEQQQKRRASFKSPLLLVATQRKLNPENNLFSPENNDVDDQNISSHSDTSNECDLQSSSNSTVESVEDSDISCRVSDWEGEGSLPEDGLTQSERAFGANVADLLRSADRKGGEVDNPVFKFDTIYDNHHEANRGRVVLDSTTALTLLWSRKHHITDEAYDDLTKIIRSRYFKREYLTSISTLKRRVSCLPLDPSYAINVPRTDVEPSDSDVDDEKSSQHTSPFVFTSLKHKLRRALYTLPQRELLDQTNCARLAQKSREFCHGTRYMSSPFFTCSTVEVRAGIFVDIGERVLLMPTVIDGSIFEVGRITGIAIDESTGKPVLKVRAYRKVMEPILPLLTNAKRTSLRIPSPFSSAIASALVYTDRELIVSDLSKIIRIVNIGTEFVSGEDYYCKWAIHEKTWKLLSDIDSHPCDFHPAVNAISRVKEALTNGATVYRIFLVLFIDGFGIYRRASHSTDGIYVTLGNYNRADRHKLPNIWTLGMKPPHTELGDCLKPLLSEVKELQQGYYFHIRGELVFVIGAIGVILADMPQAMELAGCQHHSSSFPCRRCLVSKDCLGDAKFDIIQHIRTSQSIITSRRQFGVGKGIGTQSPFEDPEIAFDICSGIPTEPMHSELGYSKKIIGLLFKALTKKYQDKLNYRIKTTKWPWSFRKLKVSKKGQLIATFTEASHFIQISCFLLVSLRPSTRESLVVKDWLQPGMFTAASRDTLSQRLGRSFCGEIQKGFVLLAASNALVFAEERDNDEFALDRLRTAVMTARNQNKKIWGDSLNIPNAHTGLHLWEAADLYGLVANVNASRFETKHAPAKKVVAQSNNRSLEKQIIRDSQIQSALSFMAQGGTSSASLTAEAKHLIVSGDSLVSKLLCHSVVADVHSFGDEKELDGQRELVWKKPLKGCALDDISKSEVADFANSDMANDISWFRVMVLPGRESYQSIVKTGEHWEICVPVPNMLPTGPRSRVSIVRITGLLCVGASVGFVEVLWLKRTSTNPHSKTMCIKYQLAQLNSGRRRKYRKFVPASWLVRRVHVYEQGDSLFLNSFFLK